MNESVSDHVVTIYQIAEDGGSAFVTMELLRGESLEDRLKRVPVVPVRDLLRIAREIATGLAAANPVAWFTATSSP